MAGSQRPHLLMCALFFNYLLGEPKQQSYMTKVQIGYTMPPVDQRSMTLMRFEPFGSTSANSVSDLPLRHGDSLTTFSQTHAVFLSGETNRRWNPMFQSQGLRHGFKFFGPCLRSGWRIRYWITSATSR